MQQRTDETGDFGAMIQQSQQKEESMQKQNQKATPDNVQDTGFDHREKQRTDHDSSDHRISSGKRHK